MSKQKKPAAKKPAVKKPAAPAKHPAPAPAKAAAKPAPKAAAPADKKPAVKGGKPTLNAVELKRMLLERKAAPKAIAFSLDEVREIAKKNEKQVEASPKNGKNGKTAAAAKAQEAALLDRPHKPHHVKAASLADILGFNPKKGKAQTPMVDESEVPEKFRRYYRLLLDLRIHVLTSLGEHTEETLLKSAKDDSGDLSGYGQHMADAGTDGICESTQKPIAKERLLAVPFTRYSAEAKKQVERHSHRSIERGGLFGDGTEEEGGKIAHDDDGGE